MRERAGPRCLYKGRARARACKPADFYRDIVVGGHGEQLRQIRERLCGLCIRWVWAARSRGVDFIDGIVVTAAVAAAPRVLTAGDPEQTVAAPQDRPGYNPPTLAGMRGSHPGSFESAHALRDGTFPKAGTSPIDTGEHYDLIVVGGGISGLAAAYFYRAAAGPDARILILDNHDDFGGHAKRNEFEFDGKIQLITGSHPRHTRLYQNRPSESAVPNGCFGVDSGRSRL